MRTAEAKAAAILRLVSMAECGGRGPGRGFGFSIHRRGNQAQAHTGGPERVTLSTEAWVTKQSASVGRHEPLARRTKSSQRSGNHTPDITCKFKLPAW